MSKLAQKYDQKKYNKIQLCGTFQLFLRKLS